MMKDEFYRTLIIAGFGGQGVLVIGNLLSYAAMKERRHVSFLPFYGVEMRGGTADCTIVISSREIGSPVVDHADAVIAMNPASLTKFESRLKSQGLLLINSSLVDPHQSSRTDVQLVTVPANDIAMENGYPKLANMVALGAFLHMRKWVEMKSVFDSFESILDEKYHSLIQPNMKAIEKGAAFLESIPPRTAGIAVSV
jgi:2-oxoglutarate ferredoxin oxidoreductase subunit gamma